MCVLRSPLGFILGAWSEIGIISDESEISDITRDINAALVTRSYDF